MIGDTRTLRLAWFLIAASPLLALAAAGVPKQGESNRPLPVVEVATCARVTYAAPSGAANEGVSAFAKPYPCGQFGNGDG